MKDPRYYCVIMAGGKGARFWPVSRTARPKQFLSYSFSGISFLKMAYRRALDVVPEENILVVSMESYRDLVMQELPLLNPDNLLLEPFNRNTAACIAYATYTIIQRNPDAVVLVMPSDQEIDDSGPFVNTVLRGLDYASRHPVLVTLGVLPTRPDTNFGYIQTDGPMIDGRPVRVKTFTEKPDKDTAQAFIDSGEFLWNAGIFIWGAKVIAEEIEHCAPDIALHWQGWKEFVGSPYEQDFLARIYPDMPRISIDYAVMEKSDRVMAIPAFFDWTDLGNWESMYEYFSVRDSKGNAVRTGGKLLSRDNEGTIIFSSARDKLVAVKGLKDFMVVDMKDVLMICPRDEKSLGDFLTELSLPEYEKFR